MNNIGLPHIIGHANEIARFLAEARNKTIGQGYIFKGPEGSGKRLSALLLSRYLNCAAPGNDDACGLCESCQKYRIEQKGEILTAHSNHTDLEILAPATVNDEGKPVKNPVIKIDAVREFQQNIAAKAYVGRLKIGIIDNAETMLEEAANCLLKTLEEPPENVVLFLVTSSFGRLLPTIRSRCRVITFHPLPPDRVKRILQSNGVQEEKADIITLFSGGSLKMALTTEFDDLAETIADAVRFLSFLYGKNLLERFLLMEKLAKEKDQERLHRFLWCFQKVLGFFVSESRRSLLAGTGFPPFETLKTLAERVTPVAASSMALVVDKVRVDLAQNLNTHLLLEIMNIKLYEIVDRGR